MGCVSELVFVAEIQMLNDSEQVRTTCSAWKVREYVCVQDSVKNVCVCVEKRALCESYSEHVHRGRKSRGENSYNTFVTSST